MTGRKVNFPITFPIIDAGKEPLARRTIGINKIYTNAAVEITNISKPNPIAKPNDTFFAPPGERRSLIKFNLNFLRIFSKKLYFFLATFICHLMLKTDLLLLLYLKSQISSILSENIIEISCLFPIFSIPIENNSNILVRYSENGKMEKAGDKEPIEMNKLDIIARRILGWKLNSWDKWYDYEQGVFIHESEFQPEQNLAHAMLIVDKLETLGFAYIIKEENEVCFNNVCATGETLAQAITNAAYSIAENSSVPDEWL
jgi:hypothetical protein